MSKLLLMIWASEHEVFCGLMRALWSASLDAGLDLGWDIDHQHASNDVVAMGYSCFCLYTYEDSGDVEFTYDVGQGPDDFCFDDESQALQFHGLNSSHPQLAAAYEAIERVIREQA